MIHQLVDVLWRHSKLPIDIEAYFKLSGCRFIKKVQVCLNVVPKRKNQWIISVKNTSVSPSKCSHKLIILERIISYVMFGMFSGINFLATSWPIRFRVGDILKWFSRTIWVHLLDWIIGRFIVFILEGLLVDMNKLFWMCKETNKTIMILALFSKFKIKINHQRDKRDIYKSIT